MQTVFLIIFTNFIPLKRCRHFKNIDWCLFLIFSETFLVNLYTKIVLSFIFFLIINLIIYQQFLLRLCFGKCLEFIKLFHDGRSNERECCIVSLRNEVI